MNRIKLVLCTVVPALLCGWLVYQHEELKWEGKLACYQAEAQEQLAKETNAILERERNLQEQVQKLELEYYDKEKAISDLNRYNSELVRRAGGLRDKGGSSGTSSSPSKADPSSGNNEANTGYVLSDKTTQFLLDLTAEADAIANQLRLCQDYVRKITQE